MSHRYREELRRRAAHDDAAFIEYMADLVVPDHLREMSAFVSRHSKAVVLEPRGFGKTTLLCHRAARLVGLARGALRIGILCAVDEDAENLAAAIRRIVEHPRFAEVFPWAAAGVEGPRWRDGAWTVRGVELGKDVTCRALSFGSVHAGPRLDLLLTDDPVGIQENATPAGRAKVLDTLLEVVLPMLVPDGRVVVSGTRWHEDDLYAQLIARGWRALVRRAIEDGRSLWPEWFSFEALAERRAALGSALFAAQYMNDPSALGGEVFRREWFTRIDVVPAGISRRVGVDLAASLAERADYTAVVELVETADHTLVIVGVWRERLADGHRAWLTGLTDAVGPAAGRAYGPPVGPRLCQPLGMLPPLFAGAIGDPALPRRLSAVNIESTAFQTVFAHELVRHTGLPVRAVRPDRDKVTRARPLAALLEAGRVVFWSRAPGLAELEDELVAFPNGAHDDLVDAAVYAADLGAPTVPAVLPLIGGKLIYSFNRSERQRDRGRSVPIAPINRIRRG